MANATHVAAETRSPAVIGAAGSGRLLGFAIVCLVPALFWIGLIALVSWTFGFAVSSTALLGGAAAISAFLAVVFAALTTNPRT